MKFTSYVQEFHICESVRAATCMRRSETEKLNEINMPLRVKERRGVRGFQEQKGHYRSIR